MPLPLPDRLSDGTELLSRSLWPLLRDSRFKTFYARCVFFSRILALSGELPLTPLSPILSGSTSVD